MVIEKSRLKVGVKGSEPVLDGELFAAIKPDDCYWNIADGKVLEITMQKVCRCPFRDFASHLSWWCLRSPHTMAPTGLPRAHAACWPCNRAPCLIVLR